VVINIENLKSPNWGEYAANQLDYYSNAERHDLICRHKLMQIYQNFCIARMQLIFSDDRTNYGDLADNEENKENIQKIFIQNALLYYNFCVDLSWTMVYFYFLPQKDNYNISSNEVENAEKIVNYEFLIKYLNMQLNNVDIEFQNKIKNLLEIITKFWNQILNDEFRKAYNYSKHQGAYDILGINIPDFFKIEGIETNIDIIKSKKFDIDKMTNMLIDFNNEFIIYIDKIINIVIEPSNIKELYHFNEIMGNIINNSIPK
jgi:hypothetical protein